MGTKTVIVVPCFNEADRLDADAFTAYAAARPRVGFLFVNDGSTDNTAAVLESLHQSNPSVFEVHSLPRNRGKAEAVRVGMLKACEGGAAITGFWDADLSTPLGELDGFLDLLEQRPDIEMVFGARINLLGRSIHRKLSRHYVGRIFATIVATTLGLPIYDTQCGAKLFRANDELVELLREPFLSRWVFDVEILARCIAARRGTDRPSVRDTVYELPLHEWNDVDGSKLRLRDFVIGSGDFLRIYRKYLWRVR